MTETGATFLPDEAATVAAGREIGLGLKAALAAGALALPYVVTLAGDLGAGKTCLCRGLCAALGADPAEVVSPTFTLANEYRGEVDIFHLDIYRLTPAEFFDAGLDEYLGRPGLTLVEWPGKMGEAFWPRRRLALSLEITHGGRLLRRA